MSRSRFGLAVVKSRRATRALAALGEQWTKAAALSPSRMLLVARLRQGLRLARDHDLTGLGWLIEAAYVYTDDSVCEPLTLPAPAEPAPPPTPWPNSSPRSPAASTSTASSPPTALPPSWTPACCPSS
ncbi:hypothetical protein ACFY8B_30300 [Streptomyces sp. NPDC012751]|uniref:hypothetical protein n=1 Tax=Streptomyces sp. NPDC012751 TaxID=3364846 RepID=UPI0036C81D53